MNVQLAAQDAVDWGSALIHDCRTRASEVFQRAIYPGFPESVTKEIIRSIPLWLPESDIVVWKHDMISIALQAQTSIVGTNIPALTIADLLRPQIWIIADGGVSPPDALSVPPDCDPAHVFLSVLIDMTYNDGERAADWFGIQVFFKNGDPIPHLRIVPLIKTRKALYVQGFFLACQAFMQLRIAAREPVVLPRATRRRMARADQRVPDVRIIQLRRREAGEGPSYSARDYHHKWIVKGHWRRLHEPRKLDGAQITFVSSYVKGPQDAPLLQPRESIYVVGR